MRVVALEGQIPIKMWLEDVEQSAMDQAMNLAKLPFAFKHIALMPDCLPDNTEILTNYGFKLISQLSNDAIICNYDPNTKKVYFSPIRDLIRRSKRIGEKIYGFVDCITDKMIVVSENHRMPLICSMGILAKDIPLKTEMQDYVWSGTGKMDQTEYSISDELLCLIAWIVGDGNIKWSNKKVDGTWASVNIRFGLRKERKITRIRSLLEALGYSYGISISSKQTSICIHVEESRFLLQFVGKNKTYPSEFISGLSTRQAVMFLEECLQVDGDWTNYQTYGTKRYNTKRDADINFLSSLASMHLGIAADSSRMCDGFQKIKMHYLQVMDQESIYDSGGGRSRTKILRKEVDYEGDLVCVECDSGFFIARQNGITFVTGNCHMGFGMPIGGVLATKNVIVPNAIGVDIGCGMHAVKTNIPVERLQGKRDELIRITNNIHNRIPVGMFHRINPVPEGSLPDIDGLSADSVVLDEYEPARYQLGTLGGGNHFIEVQTGSDGYIWYMIHSGSRNVGYKAAKYHNDVAVKLNDKWYSRVLHEWQLAFLLQGTDEFNSYIADMRWCVEFAKKNRDLMGRIVSECLMDVVGKVEMETFDIAHNYAALENHFGENVWIHRKGATRAYENEIGIIPGSQGTSSYIVKGLGNPQSFKSCSHGAGRKMSRTDARKNLTVENETKVLNERGIVHSIHSVDDLDEAPGAYKSIDEVMKNQQDLVSIEVELKPLAVIKG